MSEEIILALETAGDLCSTALLRGGKLQAERTFRHEMHLSERMTEHIESVLKDAATGFADITAFAVGLGPGSFTGVRIGVMAAKTFAFVKKVPLYGIGSLEALAAHYAGVPDTVAVTLFPCRAGTYFSAAFLTGGRFTETLLAPALSSLEELAEQLKTAGSTRILLCGQSAPVCIERLTALLPEASIGLGRAEFPHASETGFLAHLRLVSGDAGDDPLTLLPAYLAPPPITMKKPDPTGSAQ